MAGTTVCLTSFGLSFDFSVLGAMKKAIVLLQNKGKQKICSACAFACFGK
jgi:hypothetical protein